MAKPANLLLAVLQSKLQQPGLHPFERAEIRRKIREQAAKLARAEYARKAAPVRREMAGGY